MTLQVGYKAVVIPLRDGGRVAVRSGAISVGDKAVLIPGANGQLYAVRPASPQVGDKVILYPLRNGGHVCLSSFADARLQSDPVHVCDRWHRAVTEPGEVVSYGPFRYHWDGNGKVYLSGSPTAAQAIIVDDGPVVITAKGEINRVDLHPGAYAWVGILEITSLLDIGVNDIRVDVRDNPYYAISIGALTPLYIMRAL